MRQLSQIAAVMVLSTVSLAYGQEAAPVPSPNQPVPITSPPATQSDAPTSQPSSSPKPTNSAPYGEISGVVKSGNIPLPGVAVSAANTLTGQKYFTSTDVDGSFKISVAGKGRYVVRAEFAAFAPLTQEIVINDESRSGKVELSMMLLSRARKEELQQAQQEERQQNSQQIQNMGRGGMQQLSLASGGTDLDNVATGNADVASLTSAGLPNAALAADAGNESVAINGTQGRSDMNMFDPGEMQDRLADMRDQAARQGGGGGMNLGAGPGIFQIGGGGFGGGGPMGVMMGGGGRGFRNFNSNKPHGSIFYTYDGSGLDAKPYSLNGQPENKASYNQNRFGATIGGPLNIPHIYNGGTKTFIFGNYTGSRSTNPYDVFSTVPTAAERGGDFSSLLTGPNPVQLTNPATGAPFANNQITNISPIAAQLLQFVPEPNLPGNVRNFHLVSASPTNSDTGFVRFNHNFGPQQLGFGRGARQIRRQQQQQNQKKEDEKWSQSINGMFIYNNIRSDVLNPFPGLGGRQSTHNYNTSFGHTAVKGLFLNTLRFNYNRSGINTLNSFTNQNNIEGQLGITGVSQRPQDFGLPVINLAPEFSSLQDLTPVLRNLQTFSLSESMNLTRGKHGWTWGGDYRRQLIDTSNATNARGTFLFTGAATGSSFADFLLGFPGQTSLQSGAGEYNFRSNMYDLYVQDNWRAAKNLTLNLGLRYEYVTPLTELNNQLANLDVAPGFTNVAPVLPGQVGPLTGQKYPDSLVRPDRNNFAPRVGIAWKPYQKTVVRAGYGINYNMGQYGQMATQLGFQPPFAVAQINAAAPITSLTLQNGFPAQISDPNHTTNTYAVDPNYRLAYVQSWNLNLQQEAKGGVVMNIGYTGSKGTHLDIVRAPDQTQSGTPLLTPCFPAPPAGTPCAQPFLFESSEGASILHQGTLRVRKRMRNGFSMGGTYTYSKSIDDASSIGGGATAVAQNDLDIAAERSLSSFDQRHRFVADYIFDLPFGKDRKWLNNDGKAQAFFGGFAFSGNLTLASGLPFSPQVFGLAVDITRGVSGAVRPDLVLGQSIQLSDPTIQEWFNTAAFADPAGVFGTAGRNIIIGPGTVSFDMAFSKTIQVKEMQSLELRLAAINVFNTVHFTSIDATFGSPTFGQVVAAGTMRKAQLVARYRF